MRGANEKHNKPGTLKSMADVLQVSLLGLILSSSLLVVNLHAKDDERSKLA